jgi:predicted RNA-binding Zn-ribbon protein involved in translation (DUF1610 family)
MLDEEDLFCSTCGTENPMGASLDSPHPQQASLHSFRCESCGASMSYDASAKALRCPFCGSERMQQRTDSRTLRPSYVVPFEIDRNQVEVNLREWLKRGFWKPGDAAQLAAIREVTQVYVPFWVFSASTRTYWSGDTSPAPPGARGDWYPMSGEHRGNYRGLLVPASSILSSGEVEAIAPIDLSRGISPDQVDLENVVVEEFRVPKKFARPLAQGRLEALESAACRNYLRGRSRNLRVNVRVDGMTSDPFLLPIWIMVYRYKNHPYRVLINGQTGKVNGASPFAYNRLFVILMIIAIIISVIVLIAFVANAR